MSPRAAWRLEAYGFSPVYDYVNGKQEWLGYRHDREGSAVLAGDFATTDVRVCRPSDPVEDLSADDGIVVVLNEQRIVVGIIDPDKATSGRTAEEVMQEGPTTVRPAEELEPLLHRMQHAGADHVLVTTPAGEFVGILERSAAETAIPG